MLSGGVMPMRSQSRWLALLLGCSLSGAAHARSLDQQVFQLQLVIRSVWRGPGVIALAFALNPAGQTILCSICFRPCNCTVQASITLPCRTGSCWDLISVDRFLVIGFGAAV